MKEAGCKTFILHARKAILKGLTPKQNLNIPKLNYEMVYKIKKENPDLEIIINGGISKIEEIKNHLKLCDGVMIGRAIYQNPYFLTDIEKEIFKTKHHPSREEVAEKLLEYLEKEVNKFLFLFFYLLNLASQENLSFLMLYTQQSAYNFLLSEKK